MAFQTPPFSDYCEPFPHDEYRVAQQADGTVIVVRLVPKVSVVKKHIAGSCGVGCGPPPPPPMARMLSLPATKRVRVEATTYEVTVEQITCDRPLPRP
jgi:hypothetical protein